MPVDWLSIAIQASSATGVTAIFVYYMMARDKADKEERKRFLGALTDLTKKFDKSMEKSTETNKQLAVKLEGFIDSQKEFKDVLEKMYAQSLTLHKMQESPSVVVNTSPINQ